jgi:hypothetical protein
MKEKKQENTIKIESDKILVVEGKDECNFFAAILEYEKINGIQVMDIGGKDKFKNTFPNLRNSDQFDKVHTIGFIRDAEEKDATSAFQSICSTLKNNQLPVPKTINTIINKSNIKIGIFIMPNNNDAGMLEDLCIESVKTYPIFACVDQYIECCLSKNLPENNKKFNRSKAKIQTYLASKTPIANSLGIAAQKQYWNFEQKCFSELINFLNNLFKNNLLQLNEDII